MSLFTAAFGFGLVTAAVLAIGAVGFTMQFGITNLINLAYGDVMITSAFVSYALNQHGVSIWIALLAGAAWGALLSFLLNRFLYGPFQRKGTSHIGLVIISLAAGIMTSNLLLALVGADNVSYVQSAGATFRLAGMILTTEQVVIIVIALVLMVVIHGLLTYTRLGKAMRATAANPTLARNCGIPTNRVIDVVWIMTGLMCGLAGTIAAMNSESFAVANGSGFLITILAAAVLGGAGQPYGAMIGAIVIGLVTEMSAAVLSPEYKAVIAFVILVTVMVLRPQGLLAKFGAAASAG
ncbi:MAG: branched-chain amino acid ABC transporter permease [Candidatus Dormibacter sp.]|uniref:branched-chain amino acid ABC transporter permease n=1 Tax=Candidatus Dormibacter sp. TaxID=2973982 RepID=UPI003D9AF596